MWRPLLAPVVVLLVLVGTYVGSYALWGRKVTNRLWMNPGGLSEREAKLLIVASRLWTPLREWDFERTQARARRDFTGNWELPDGRKVELELLRDGVCAIRSKDFRRLNFDGIWGSLVVLGEHDARVSLSPRFEGNDISDLKDDNVYLLGDGGQGGIQIVAEFEEAPEEERGLVGGEGAVFYPAP